MDYNFRAPQYVNFDLSCLNRNDSDASKFFATDGFQHTSDPDFQMDDITPVYDDETITPQTPSIPEITVACATPVGVSKSIPRSNIESPSCGNRSSAPNILKDKTSSTPKSTPDQNVGKSSASSTVFGSCEGTPVSGSRGSSLVCSTTPGNPSSAPNILKDKTSNTPKSMPNQNARKSSALSTVFGSCEGTPVSGFRGSSSVCSTTPYLSPDVLTSTPFYVTNSVARATRQRSSSCPTRNEPDSPDVIQTDYILSVAMKSLRMSTRSGKLDSLTSSLQDSFHSLLSKTPQRSVNLHSVKGTDRGKENQFSGQNDSTRPKRKLSPAPANLLDYNMPPEKYIRGGRTRVPKLPKREPFKLTEYKRKKVTHEPPKIFKARPMPRFCKASASGLHTKSNPGTSQGQVFSVDGNDKVEEKCVVGYGVSFSCYHRKTCPKPFSFEARDQEMKRKREEKLKRLQKQEEEERKKKAFHANPLPMHPTPKNLKCDMKTAKTKAHRRHKSVGSLDNSPSKEKNHVFRARPPTVLQKEPFKPQKPERQPIQPVGLLLHTEQRAKEREEFERHLRERQMELDIARQEKNELEQKKLQMEIAKIRKKLVHKALPLPNYRPFEVRKSDKQLTSPHTPAFIHNKIRSNGQTAVAKLHFTPESMESE